MNTSTGKNSSVSILMAAAVFAVAASVSVAASAGNYSETRVTTSAEGLRTTTVSYADLDLNSVTARETLQHRLSRAALKVCGSPYRATAGSLAQAAQNRSCSDNAVAEAMRTISVSQMAVAGR
jgi:UrcA family protein